MTKKKIRELYKIISPEPGFILDLTRTELEILVEDLTAFELSDAGSNGARLQSLLLAHTEAEMNDLVINLIARQGYH